MANLLASLPERHFQTGCGVYSICSAHPISLEAGVLRALEDNSSMVLEATSNQVDQYGGYTGMTPASFRDWVVQFTGKMGLPKDRLVLGGDHLGPNPWRNEPASQAMDKARVLIREYAAAGFTKLHLDCSMSLGGDAGQAPSQELVAERAADLCKTAEAETAAATVKPVYVIGTEVPIPGGVAHDVDTGLAATRVDDAAETLKTHQRIFAKYGLEDAWSRVIALVVQPGVEFGNYSVAEYNPKKARDLSSFIAATKDIVFEAHSTDYQTEKSLTALVDDHFAILKVGPWLTWAYREALFGLADIADELSSACGLRQIIDEVMTSNPQYWQGHYHGSPKDLKLARAFSFSDRIRYYLPDPKIQQAIDKLVRELSTTPIPLSLLSQYLPVQYEEVREGVIANKPHELLRSAVYNVLTVYARATGNTRTATPVS
ncbi:MAG: D-tagatose-bisphosphate aldolase, class II, non-catalytic subunit [Planctomycetaceae bacterium]|nr:D-tagatose-bisphosphate aldolase, class II, non-catalytic subunit [Planctomycetaceae bacterium]